MKEMEKYFGDDQKSMKNLNDRIREVFGKESIETYIVMNI